VVSCHGRAEDGHLAQDTAKTATAEDADREVVARFEQIRLAAAGRLLGLPVGDGTAGVRVERVAPIATGWLFAIGGTAVPRADLLVEDADGTPRCLLRTDHLALSLSGGADSPVLRRLAEALARRLRTVTPARLAWWLHDRPLAEAEAPVIAPVHEPPSSSRGAWRPPPAGAPCPALHRAWNHPRAWSRFFADDELAMHGDGVAIATGPSLRVEHGDLECQFLRPRGFVGIPWQPLGSLRHHNRKWGSVRQRLAVAGRGRAGSPAPRSTDEEKCLYTNVIDVDVIEGATPLLERLLESVRRHMKPEMVMVNCTCVPQMVGDDVEDVVARERSASPWPVLYKDQSTEDPFERNLAMMAAAFRDAPPVERDPAAVNLVGFARGRDRDELAALLGSLGVRVNRYLVPEVSPAVASGYLAAPLQVLYPNPAWERLYESLVRPLDCRTVAAPAPYGPRGTADFLVAVADALSRSDLADRAREEVGAFAARTWQPLVAAPSRHRLGLIAETRSLHRLSAAAGLWGLPLVPLLLEMGFRVGVAIVAEPGGREAADRACEAWRGGVDAAVVETPADLDAWLAGSGVGPVFSDYAFDDRLVSRGHATFSARVFEKGLLGAERTIRRLLDLARMTCYRDHAFAFRRGSHAT